MFTRYREPIEVESTLQSIARQDSYRCCERAPNSDGERRLFDGRLLSPRSFNSRSIYLCYYRWYDYLHLENRILYHVGPRPKNEGGNASIQNTCREQSIVSFEKQVQPHHQSSPIRGNKYYQKYIMPNLLSVRDSGILMRLIELLFSLVVFFSANEISLKLLSFRQHRRSKQTRKKRH
jgi:hypothetical protein